MLTNDFEISNHNSLQLDNGTDGFQHAVLTNGSEVLGEQISESGHGDVEVFVPDEFGSEDTFGNDARVVGCPQALQQFDDFGGIVRCDGCAYKFSFVCAPISLLL